MSDLLDTLLAPASWFDEVFGDEPEETHIWCCRPDRSLCGIDMNDEWEDVGEGVFDDCERCRILDVAAVPCGAPFCRLRRRIRQWRSS